MQNTMNTEVALSLQLGRFCISPPLRVDLKEMGDSSDYRWAAFLEPGEITCHEWGSGKGPVEALQDLEATIGEMKELFAKRAEGTWSEELLNYKRMLEQYVVMNTNCGWMQLDA